MDLTVVIVAYNNDTVLLDCLKSISLHNDIGGRLEVIVVDNYVNSFLGDIINTLEYNYELLYFKNESNIGFGAANNIGVSLASSDIILFLNPDTILIEPVFGDVCQKIISDRRTVYGFTLIDKFKKVNNSYSIFFEYYYLLPVVKLCKKIDFYLPNKLKCFNKIVWPWGAAFALSKSSFIAAGEFDNDIFLCNEEPDLMKRIPSRTIFISNKRIIHLEGHGEIVSEERYFQYFKSLNYYFHKYKLSFSGFYFIIRLKIWYNYVVLHNHAYHNIYNAFKRFSQNI